jgi:hypothetical protein
VGQLLTSGVHAFKDQLRVVLVPAQRDIYHHQLGYTFAQCDQVALTAVNPYREVFIVLRDAPGMFFRQLLACDNGNERVSVGLGEDELVMPLAFFFRVDELIILQLAR